jgi:hypothetical protein
MCESQRLTTLWASMACYRDRFIIFLYPEVNILVLFVVCLMMLSVAQIVLHQKTALALEIIWKEVVSVYIEMLF